MKANFFAHIGGFVRVKCVTSDAAFFIETLKKQKLSVWDVSFADDATILLSMHARHFLQVRKLVKMTRSQLTIVHKHGWPVWRKLWKQKKWWMIGVIPAALLFAVYMSLIWRVEVSGNERLTAEQIRTVAATHGMDRMAWRFRLPDPTVIGKKLQRQLPGVAWVGVEVRGVVVKITVVETRLPESKPIVKGHHLVARTSAIISHVFAERGKPLVSIHQRVRKGDVLISGWIGGEEHSQLVEARGMVKGLVWYDIHMKIPLRRTLKTMTGQQLVRNYAVIGGKAVRISGQEAPPFSRYVTDRQVEPYVIVGRKLPFGTMRETLREITVHVIRLQPAEAKKIAVTQGRLHFLRNLSKWRASEAVIRKQQLFLQKQTKSHLYLRVFFVVVHYMFVFVSFMYIVFLLLLI
jgi:similar to stage IV sporulation protein